MNVFQVSGIFMAILLLGFATSNSHLAFATSSKDTLILKKDLKSIMKDYTSSVAKAKKDLLSSVKKANEDAKLAIKKGIPIDEINSLTKATIAKARTTLKLDLQMAKVEAKNALLELKAAVDRNNHS